MGRGQLAETNGVLGRGGTGAPMSAKNRRYVSFCRKSRRPASISLSTSVFPRKKLVGS